MSYILYYSNYCSFSKNVLNNVSKNPSVTKEVHFICIDKRIQEKGKTFIILENGQKIIMPENIQKVPSLLLINDGFRVIDNAEHIIQFFQPRKQQETREATMNNMEPVAFGFEGVGSCVVSDNYSFLDQDSKQMEAKNGTGGLRQMHNYVGLNDNSSIYTPEDEVDYNNGPKISENMTIDQLMQKRENDFNLMAPKR
jgi:hypothetical protein